MIVHVYYYDKDTWYQTCTICSDVESAEKVLKWVMNDDKAYGLPVKDSENFM